MLTPGHVGQPPLPAAAHRPQHGMYTLARVIWASRGLLARKTAGQRAGGKFISFASVYIPGKGVYTPDKGVANPATPDAYQDEAGRRETPGPPARPVLLGHPSCRHGQSGPPEDPVLSATAGWTVNGLHVRTYNSPTFFPRPHKSRDWQSVQRGASIAEEGGGLRKVAPPRGEKHAGVPDQAETAQRPAL